MELSKYKVSIPLGERCFCGRGFVNVAGSDGLGSFYWHTATECGESDNSYPVVRFLFRFCQFVTGLVARLPKRKNPKVCIYDRNSDALQ